MAGPHAHDDDKAHEVIPTDAPTAEIGLYFGTQTGKTEQVCGIIKNELGDVVSEAGLRELEKSSPFIIPL